MEASFRLSGSDLRDSEDRRVKEQDPLAVREEMLDKTISDSFPASDSPSDDSAPAVGSFAHC